MEVKSMSTTITSHTLDEHDRERALELVCSILGQETTEEALIPAGWAQKLRRYLMNNGFVLVKKYHNQSGDQLTVGEFLDRFGVH
jgi:SOS response regulatory protein OraA/RecX